MATIGKQDVQLSLLAAPKAGSSRLSLSIGDEVPTEFRIFSYGENPSEKGTFLFDASSATSVMAEFAKHGKPMLLDFNHGTTFAEPTPEQAIAAGQFTPEVRGDGLWATAIKWTDRAMALLKAKEYRLFSPFFTHKKDGTVLRLINVALTNLPALDHIAPLMAASAKPEGDEMDYEKLYNALKAKFDEMETECSALRAKLSAMEPKTAAAATLRATIMTLTGKTDDDAAIGVITALKASHDKVVALEAKLAEIEGAKLTADFAAALSKAVTDGKVAPAQKAFWETMAKEDGFAKATSRLNAFAETATKLTGVGTDTPAEPKKATSAESQVQMKTLGWSAEKIAAFNKDQASAS